MWEAVKKLEEELNDQNTAVAKAKTELSRCQSEYQKTGNKVEDWKTKLNNAEAQVIKANSAVAENARYMDEAAASADKCAKSIDVLCFLFPVASPLFFSLFLGVAVRESGMYLENQR